MEELLLLLAAWGIAVVINVVPAFMPPTWSVLAVFHVTTDVPLLPLTIGGAAASAVGRTGLYLASRHLNRLLPETDCKNAQALGEFVERHKRWRTAIIFLYCLAPLPSNPIFIAAGVARMSFLPVIAAFFLARAIADTFWVWTAGAVSREVGDAFTKQLTDWRTIAIQVASIGVLVLVFRLPWAKWLGVGGQQASGTPRRRSRRTPARA